MTATNGRGMGPNQIDIHVGRRIKTRRQLLHISQESLAGDIGVTFQQVQKYESGHNRVSASRLYEIAKVLDVPMAFFFEELPATAKADADKTLDPMQTTEATEFVRRLSRLSDGGKTHLLGLMDSMLRRESPVAAAAE